MKLTKKLKSVGSSPKSWKISDNIFFGDILERIYRAEPETTTFNYAKFAKKLVESFGQIPLTGTPVMVYLDVVGDADEVN